MTIQVRTDRTLVRAAGSSVRYVLLSFEAPEAPAASARAAINVAFVVDRSGSMGGSKIRLAREAVVMALRMLKPADRFAVVSYDHEVEVVVPSTPASAEAVRNAIAQVEQLQARGNTDLGGGWLKGCEQVAEHLRQEQVSRCLLLSDGLANHGITDRDELARHAAALKQRGISSSTFGIGADYDERLLAGLATAGEGHFYYIETAEQIPDLLTSELGETLEVVARDAVVTVHPPAGVEMATLNRFAVVRDRSSRAVVKLGDLVSRQEASIVLRLEFPAAAVQSTARVLFGVADAQGVLTAPDTDLIWTYADHAANDAQARNVVVDRAVAKLYAAQALAEALELNRAGNYAEARERLTRTARRIEQYAGTDPELRAIIRDLLDRDHVYAVPLSASLSKSEHYASWNVSRMRDDTGKAKRGT